VECYRDEMTSRFVCLLVLVLSACAADAAPSDDTSLSSAALTTPVPSMVGVAGTHLRLGWPVPEGQPTRLTLTELARPGTTSSHGTYVARIQVGACLGAACPLETGEYFADPENPAIGWATLRLLPAGATSAVIYVVEGILRDFAGRILQMQLRPLDPNAPDSLGAPFLMQRLF
jgi:hypothetical protein